MVDVLFNFRGPIIDFVIEVEEDEATKMLRSLFNLFKGLKRRLYYKMLRS